MKFDKKYLEMLGPYSVAGIYTWNCLECQCMTSTCYTWNDTGSLVVPDPYIEADVAIIKPLNVRYKT